MNNHPLALPLVADSVPIVFDPRFALTLVEHTPARAVLRCATANGEPASWTTGLLAALADAAGWLALTALLDAPPLVPASELGISLLGPPTGDALTATTTLLKQGRTLVVYDVDLTDEADALVARARVSYPASSSSQTTRKP